MCPNCKCSNVISTDKVMIEEQNILYFYKQVLVVAVLKGLVHDNLYYFSVKKDLLCSTLYNCNIQMFYRRSNHFKRI